MASKSPTAAKYIYDTLVMVSLGAWKMTFAGNTANLAVRLIPILTHLSPRWTAPLSHSSPLHLLHRLNMVLDQQNLFRLHVQLCITVLSSAEAPLPAFGLMYEGAIGQPR
jgi:hypothetical protein